MSPVMKLLWGVTLTATLIFVIQTVMTFLGADADGTDFDMDVDTSMDGSDLSNIEGGSNLYTFRNLVNFFLGFFQFGLPLAFLARLLLFYGSCPKMWGFGIERQLK